MIRRGIAGDQLFHRRNEIVRDRAADAAIGEFDNVVRIAGIIAAIGQQAAIDADIAELVDDQRDPPAARILQEVTDQRRLTGSEEAGDDRRRNA